MFDTLRYSKILEAVGVSRDQAEAHMKVLTEMMQSDLATKQDMRDLKDEMQKLEYRLVIKLGTVAKCIAAIAVTFLKFAIASH